tara:strand:+ start:1427 stop:1933 length:507 start_codon:yes stop_codon:yes gene_type:complete
MELNIVDDFLSHEDHRQLKNLIVFNQNFPLHFQREVSGDKKHRENWDWYATHTFYHQDHPCSPYTNDICNYFIPKFMKMDIFRSLMRVRVNFYPYTNRVKEHSPHVDYKFSHYAAIYCLNTCDGFTRIGREKVKSVANRIYFFDGSVEHNSSTTSNECGRYNLNFNFL